MIKTALRCMKLLLLAGCLASIFGFSANASSLPDLLEPSLSIKKPIGIPFEVNAGDVATFVPESGGYYALEVSEDVAHELHTWKNGEREDWVGAVSIKAAEGLSQKIYDLKGGAEYYIWVQEVDFPVTITIRKVESHALSNVLEIGGSVTVPANTYGEFLIPDQEAGTELYLKLDEKVEPSDVSVWDVYRDANGAIKSIDRKGVTLINRDDASYLYLFCYADGVCVCVNKKVEASCTYELAEKEDIYDPVPNLYGELVIPANSTSYFSHTSEEPAAYAIYVPKQVSLEDVPYDDLYETANGILYFVSYEAGETAYLNIKNSNSFDADIEIIDLYMHTFPAIGGNTGTKIVEQADYTLFEWTGDTGFVQAKYGELDINLIAVKVETYKGGDCQVSWEYCPTFTDADGLWELMWNAQKDSYRVGTRTLVLLDTSIGDVTVKTREELTGLQELSVWGGTYTIEAGKTYNFRYAPLDGEDEPGKLAVIRSSVSPESVKIFTPQMNGSVDIVKYNEAVVCDMEELDGTDGDNYFVITGHPTEDVEVQFATFKEAVFPTASTIQAGAEITIPDAFDQNYVYKFTPAESGFYKIKNTYSGSFYKNDGSKCEDWSYASYMKANMSYYVMFRYDGEEYSEPVVLDKWTAVDVEQGKSYPLSNEETLYRFVPDKTGAYRIAPETISERYIYNAAEEEGLWAEASKGTFEVELEEGNEYYFFERVYGSGGPTVYFSISPTEQDPGNQPGSEPQKQPDIFVDTASRIYGSNRYKTSLKIADALKANYGVEKFNTVIVASGTSFADALAGSYLAYAKQAPILMAGTSNAADIQAYVRANVNAGGTVYLLGGEKALPNRVVSGLSGYNIKRLWGSNRYATNLEILKECQVSSAEFLVCTGTGFADSLSASAAKRPILLVGKTLSAEQKAYLSTVSGSRFYIIGGTKAVSEEVRAELKAYGSCERIGGVNRYETTVKIAEKFFDSPKAAVLAYARNFPDGLCGGPLAASMDAPLILTASAQEGAAAAYAEAVGIDHGVILGGSGLISDSAAKNVLNMDVKEW